MSLIFFNGVLLFRNGILAKDPACCCESDCCCDNLTDLYVEATVGSCSATGTMMREPDGSYGGFPFKLWSISLDLGGSTLIVYVYCSSRNCAMGFYSETCHGLPPDFDPYDIGSMIWNTIPNCSLPQNFSRPGACNNATCGMMQTLNFSVSNVPF